MKRTWSAFTVGFFLIISLGIAFFLYIWRQLPVFSISDHRFRPSGFFLLLVTGAIFVLLWSSWRILAKIESRKQIALQPYLLMDGLIPYFPLGLFLLSPLLLNFYITNTDLKVRLQYLMLIALIYAVYLKLCQLGSQFAWKEKWERGVERFSALPMRKKLVILFAAAFILYNIATLCMVSRGFAYTGDEPYYLMTTTSLYQDQDINVANNYSQNDHFQFYPREIYPNLRLRAYARFGRKGTDYAYPISQPGTSVLILPFFWLSRFFSGRAIIFILKGSLSLWAVLLGLQIYLYSREHWKKEQLSLILWLIYSFSAPVLFYAIHIYPAAPIALFSFYIYRKVRSSDPLKLWHYFFLGFLLSLFFWFGLKFNMIFWPLLLVSIYFMIKIHRAGWKIIAFLFFPFLSLGLNYYYIYALYGTFNPIAIYEGVVTSSTLQNYKEIILNTPIMLRIDTFLDYFLGQRDGLLLYSPLYFFAFLGFIEVYRRSKKDLLALIFIAFPFILNYAFFAHRQGGCPQGRVLAPLSWVGILFVGYFLAHNHKRIYSTLFRLSCLASLIIPVLLLRQPAFLYQPTTHEYTFRGADLFISLSNLNFYLPGLLPSFPKINNLGYIPNYVWLGLILLLAAGYIYKKDLNLPPRSSIRVAFIFPVIIILFLWLSLYPRLTLLHPTEASYSPGKSLGFYGLERHSRMLNPGEFHLTRDNYHYTFNFTSWREIKNLKLTFGSLEGHYKITVKLFDLILFQDETHKNILTKTFPFPEKYPYKNTLLYQIQVKLERVSGPTPQEIPYLFSIYPDNK